MAHVPGEIALALPNEEPIIFEYTPDAIVGATIEDILKEVKESTIEVVIDTRITEEGFCLIPRTSEGPVEVNGEFAYGAVTLPEEGNDINLHFAENYYVYGFSPEIIETPTSRVACLSLWTLSAGRHKYRP